LSGTVGTEDWAPLLRGLREPEPGEDADAAMDAEWQEMVDRARREFAAHEQARGTGAAVPPRTPAGDRIEPMDIMDDEYHAGVRSVLSVTL
jgi:hypothetical protein